MKILLSLINNYYFQSSGKGMFIHKLDDQGNSIWLKSIESDGVVQCHGLEVDNSGNIYITGVIAGTSDIDPSTNVLTYSSIAAGDIYIAKLNEFGELLWFKSYFGTALFGNIGLDLRLNNNEEPVICGTYWGDIELSTSPSINYPASSSLVNSFILTLNQDGQYVQSFRLGEEVDASCFDISSDGSFICSGICAGSETWGTGSFAQTVVTTPGSFFLASYNSNGDLLWLNIYPDANAEAFALELDDNDNIYLTGQFMDSLNLDLNDSTQYIQANGGWDIFLFKTDILGQYLWGQQYGSGINGESGHGIVIDRNNDVYLTGEFKGLVDFDYGSNIEYCEDNCGSGAFILHLKSNGQFSWVRMIKSIGNDSGMDICVDNNGGVYTTGYFSWGSDINTDSLYSQVEPGHGTTNEAFLIKLNSPLDFANDNESNYLNVPVVYPNPTNGIVNITYESSQNQEGVFVIYNLDGKEVLRHFLHAGYFNETIYLSHLNKGIYIYSFQIDGNSTQGKILLQ